jgi:hypothetical protein
MIKRIVAIAIVLFAYGANAYPPVNLFNATCAFVTTTKGMTGSAFLVSDSSIANEYRLYLITNKHVLLSDTNLILNVRVNMEVGDSERVELRYVSIPVCDSLGADLSCVRRHPIWDVCAVNVTSFMFTDSTAVQGRWIAKEFLVQSDSLSNWGVTAGDDVLILGYPDGIHDSTRRDPIVRKGTLATDPSLDFSFPKHLIDNWRLPNSIPGFLVDGNVFPGSSGSLVFLRPDFEPFLSRTKPWIYEPVPIGILFGSLPIYDDGIGALQRLGLGLVLNNSAIRETIDLFK